MDDLTRSNSLADLAARIRAAVDTKVRSCEQFGNDADRGADVDTKLGGNAHFGNDGVGFIRVRKRKLKALASSSMSFDLVRAVRANGKPRHEFVLGLGSQKDADRDWALCWFWARAIRRMIKRGLAEDRRSRLIAEMVRKGARLPPITECEKFVRCYSEHDWNQPEVSELIHWLRKAEAPPDPNGWPELPACLRRAVP